MNANYKPRDYLLLIDETPSATQTRQQLISEGFGVLRLRTVTEIHMIIDAIIPDLIVVHHADIDVFQVCKTIRQRSHLEVVPIVVWVSDSGYPETNWGNLDVNRVIHTQNIQNLLEAIREQL